MGCKKTPIKGSYYCVNHQFSTISTEQVGIIKIVIIFLVGKIRFWQQTLYTYSFFQSYLVSHTDNENQLQCKTEKRKQAANKHRSAGICCAVYNRGIIVGITELFGCESLSQVYEFLRIPHMALVYHSDFSKVICIWRYLPFKALCE